MGNRRMTHEMHPSKPTPATRPTPTASRLETEDTKGGDVRADEGGGQVLVDKSSSKAFRRAVTTNADLSTGDLAVASMLANGNVDAKGLRSEVYARYADKYGVVDAADARQEAVRRWADARANNSRLFREDRASGLENRRFRINAFAEGDDITAAAGTVSQFGKSKATIDLSDPGFQEEILGHPANQNIGDTRTGFATSFKTGGAIANKDAAGRKIGTGGNYYAGPGDERDAAMSALFPYAFGRFGNDMATPEKLADFWGKIRGDYGQFRGEHKGEFKNGVDAINAFVDGYDLPDNSRGLIGAYLEAKDHEAIGDASREHTDLINWLETDADDMNRITDATARRRDAVHAAEHGGVAGGRALTKKAGTRDPGAQVRQDSKGGETLDAKTRADYAHFINLIKQAQNNDETYEGITQGYQAINTLGMINPFLDSDGKKAAFHLQRGELAVDGELTPESLAAAYKSFSKERAKLWRQAGGQGQSYEEWLAKSNLSVDSVGDILERFKSNMSAVKDPGAGYPVLMRSKDYPGGFAFGVRPRIEPSKTEKLWAALKGEQAPVRYGAPVVDEKLSELGRSLALVSFGGDDLSIQHFAKPAEAKIRKELGLKDGDPFPSDADAVKVRTEALNAQKAKIDQRAGLMSRWILEELGQENIDALANLGRQYRYALDGMLPAYNVPFLQEDVIDRQTGRPTYNYDRTDKHCNDYYDVKTNTVDYTVYGRQNVRQDAKGGDVAPDADPAVSDKPPAEERPESPEPSTPARIIINPKVFKDKRDGLCVALNEAFRVAMEMMGVEPVAEPTDAQRKFFADTAYAGDEVQLRRTIMARICTFDTSVKDPTDEQLEESVGFLEDLAEAGFPKSEWEQSMVQRIHDAIAAVHAPPDGDTQIPGAGAGSSAPPVADTLGGQADAGEDEDEEGKKKNEGLPDWMREFEPGPDLTGEQPGAARGASPADGAYERKKEDLGLAGGGVYERKKEDLGLTGGGVYERKKEDLGLTGGGVYERKKEDLGLAGGGPTGGGLGGRGRRFGDTRTLLEDTQPGGGLGGRGSRFGDTRTLLEDTQPGDGLGGRGRRFGDTRTLLEDEEDQI